MDEDRCSMCGKLALAGRLYCSDACLDADVDAVRPDASPAQTVRAVMHSRPLGTGVRPPPINTYSYPMSMASTRRSSRSISTSDMDYSSAASTSSAARTSPPSSLNGDDDDAESDEIEPEKFYSRYQDKPNAARRQSTTACTPLRLTFARRPSQTNSRPLVPVAVASTASTGTSQHRRHASLADHAVAARPARSPVSHTAPLAWRMTAIQVQHKPVDSKKHSPHARQSLPASLSRVFGAVSPSPTPPLQPLLTIAHVDTTGISLPRSAATSTSSSTTTASVPLSRNWSQATVRVGRNTASRPLHTAPRKAPVDDSAIEGDHSEVERVVEPLRGRARTRTRRESTASAVLRRVDDDASPRGRTTSRTAPAVAAAAAARVTRSRNRSP